MGIWITLDWLKERDAWPAFIEWFTGQYYPIAGTTPREIVVRLKAHGKENLVPWFLRQLTLDLPLRELIGHAHRAALSVLHGCPEETLPICRDAMAMVERYVKGEDIDPEAARKVIDGVWAGRKRDKSTEAEATALDTIEDVVAAAKYAAEGNEDAARRVALGAMTDAENAAGYVAERAARAEARKRAEADLLGIIKTPSWVVYEVTPDGQLNPFWSRTFEAETELEAARMVYGGNEYKGERFAVGRERGKEKVHLYRVGMDGTIIRE